MEQVHTQVSRLFHQAEFVLVLNKAEVADQGLGQGLEEAPAASRLCDKGPDRQPWSFPGRRRIVWLPSRPAIGRTLRARTW